MEWLVIVKNTLTDKSEFRGFDLKKLRSHEDSPPSPTKMTVDKQRQIPFHVKERKRMGSKWKIIGDKMIVQLSIERKTEAGDRMGVSIPSGK